MCYYLTMYTFLCIQKLEKKGIKSHYFPTFYGDFVGVHGAHNVTSALMDFTKGWNNSMSQMLHWRGDKGLKLVYRSSEVHQSLVTLTFAADNVLFVENRYVFCIKLFFWHF